MPTHPATLPLLTPAEAKRLIPLLRCLREYLQTSIDCCVLDGQIEAFDPIDRDIVRRDRKRLVEVESFIGRITRLSA